MGPSEAAVASVVVAEGAAAAEAGTVIATAAVEAAAAAVEAVVITVEVVAAAAAVLLIDSCHLVSRCTTAAEGDIAAEEGVGLAAVVRLVLAVTAARLAQATKMMLCKERCKACSWMASMTTGNKQCLQAAVAEAAVAAAGAAVGVEGVNRSKQV
jgi:hypothetical protein